MAAADEQPPPAETTPEDAAAERGPTIRVVMQHERVIVVPGNVTAEQCGEIAKVLSVGSKRVKTVTPVDGWIRVGEFEGASKDDAIEAHAGKAGTDTALIGMWKAPTVRAWAGGVKHSAPPKPLVEREAID